MPFPAQPWTNGQQYNDGTYTYQYNSTLRTWTKVKQTTSNISLTPSGTGGNITVGNTVISNTAITANTLSTTGNANLGNISTSGAFSATGNVAAGNVSTAGAVSATGNVSGGNVTTSGVISATGNVSGGNVTTSGVISATGNVSGGNVTSSGAVSATGNVSGGNVTTSGAVSATGNVSGGNVTSSGAVSAAGNITGANISTSGAISATGNVTANLFIGNGSLLTGLTFPISNGNSNIAAPSANGNINVTVAGNANVVVFTGTGVNVAGTLSTTGNASVLGIRTDNYYYANGVQISFAGSYSDANATALLASFGSNTISTTGNITGGNLITPGRLSATGNSNVGNIGATLFVGTLATGAQPNITSVGTLTSLSVSGNANIGNIGTAGLITAAGNITGAFFIGNGSQLTGISATFPIANGNSNIAAPSANGNINVSVAGNANVAVFTGTGANINGTLSVSGNANFANITLANASTISGNNMTLTTGANTNIGTITGNWSLSTGSRLQATYADLAEYYEADQHYEPGTVLEFGGEKEVTLASDGTIRVAGVVSTNPAYALNANCQGIAVAIALQGRVPCKVRGNISKGDIMISGGDGYARPCSAPIMGSVIGKSLENFSSLEGIIEIAVGRL